MAFSTTQAAEPGRPGPKDTAEDTYMHGYFFRSLAYAVPASAVLLETAYIGKGRSFKKNDDPSRFWKQISAETGTAAAFLILLLNL